MNKSIFRGYVLIGLTGFVLAGCATNYRDKPAEEVAQNIRVVDNEFSKDRMYIAPPVNGTPVGGVDYTAQLAAIQSKTDGNVIHALRVTWSYRNNRWFFFSSAKLPGAVSLPTVVNDRNVDSCGSYGSCSYTEKVSAVIPLAALAAANNGLRVQFGSDQGWTVVELPQQYVLGYLQGISAATGASASALPAAPRIPKWEPVPTRPAQPSVQPTASSSASKAQLLDELSNTSGLSYEEYTRRYKAITGE